MHRIHECPPPWPPLIEERTSVPELSAVAPVLRARSRSSAWKPHPQTKASPKPRSARSKTASQWRKAPVRKRTARVLGMRSWAFPVPDIFASDVGSYNRRLPELLCLVLSLIQLVRMVFGLSLIQLVRMVSWRVTLMVILQMVIKCHQQNT